MSPHRVSLADYLAGLLLNDSYGFAPDLADYADLLDETGTARILTSRGPREA